MPKKRDNFLRVKLDDKLLRQDLRRVNRRIDNMAPAWEEVGEIVLRSIMLNFRDEGRPAKWKDFAPSTRRRRGDIGSAKLLDDTGRMKQSISWKLLNQHSVQVGTNLGGKNSYAATHHYGRPALSSIKTRKRLSPIPARPFILVQDQDIPEIEQALIDHIVRPMI
jgi:phage virion morphogenesis protein